MTRGQKHHFSVRTEVTFKVLAECEIDYYINTYQPFDKAGAYGIQEWIGYIGCTGLKGSYYNVMGLPVQRIYEELERWWNGRCLRQIDIHKLLALTKRGMPSFRSDRLLGPHRKCCLFPLARLRQTKWKVLIWLFP